MQPAWKNFELDMAAGKGRRQAYSGGGEFPNQKLDVQLFDFLLDLKAPQAHPQLYKHHVKDWENAINLATKAGYLPGMAWRLKGDDETYDIVAISRSDFEALNEELLELREFEETICGLWRKLLKCLSPMQRMLKERRRPRQERTSTSQE